MNRKSSGIRPFGAVASIGSLKTPIKMFATLWAIRVPTKKRTICEIRGEKNAVPSSDIMLDDARSAQGKSRGLSRG